MHLYKYQGLRAGMSATGEDTVAAWFGLGTDLCCGAAPFSFVAQLAGRKAAPACMQSPESQAGPLCPPFIA